VGLAVAAVWLLHPLNTQSVTYVVQRCESMMGLCFLAACAGFLRGATAERHSKWWYAGAWVAALVGVGCKEMMVALPPLLLLLDRTFLTGSWRESLRERWKVLALLAIPPLIGVVALFASGLVTGKEATVGAGVLLFTPYSYALTQTEVILHYLRLAVWPTGLALDYLDWPARQSLKEVWPTALGLGVLLAATTYGVVRNRVWAFPAAWFFVNLAPTSSFVPLQDAAFEHRMYLPLIGVVVLFVGAVVWAARGRAPRVGGAVLGLVAVVLGFLTVVRNEDYANPVKMHGKNVEQRPNNSRIRGLYADMIRQMGRLAEAEAHMRRALELPRATPGDRQTYTMILSEMGQIDEALRVIKIYHDADPDDADLRRQHGFLLVVAGRFAEAVPHLKAALEKEPNERSLRLNLVIALGESGQDATAEREELKKRFPKYPPELALSARRTAVNPHAIPPQLKMAALYAAVAQKMGDPADPEYADTLAVCLARLGLFDEAVKAEEQATALSLPQGDEYRTGLLRTRLELFRAKKPYLPESFTPDFPKRAAP
jgi:Flp pilus assembly protein TadD